MNVTGTNTMQMHSVLTNAGTAICWAPSRIAFTRRLRMCRLRWMFSISTVASSTRMPTARAMPPSVMVFSVSPIAPRMMIETRIDSGIDTMTISVLRQEPRNSRIISPVSPAAMAASLMTPCTLARTKTDWSNSGVIFRPLAAGGRAASMAGIFAFTASTTASVEALPLLRIGISTPRWPLAWTMFVCT